MSVLEDDGQLWAHRPAHSWTNDIISSNHRPICAPKDCKAEMQEWLHCDLDVTVDCKLNSVLLSVSCDDENSSSYVSCFVAIVNT